MLLVFVTAFLIPSPILALGPPNIAALQGFTSAPTGSVLLVVGDLSIRNPHGTKPAGVSFQAGRDSTPLGFIAGLLTNNQSFIFDTNPMAVNSSSGRPIGTYTTIFSIGGPDVNAVTSYYEKTSLTGDRASLLFSVAGGNDVWTDMNGTVVWTVPQSSNSIPPGTSDVFVIQVLQDTNGRLVALMYGTTYLGTWAAALYFTFMIYPNISTYQNGYYLIRWTDATSGATANYMPDTGDTFTILATAVS